MTERNTNPRNHYAQNQGRRHSRTADRHSVASARDELERERELYSAHDPQQSAASPAQRYAEEHGGTVPTPSRGTSAGARQATGSWSAAGRQGTGSWTTGAFPADAQASQPSQRIPRISQSGSLAAVRRAGEREPIAHSSRLTPADRLSGPGATDVEPESAASQHSGWTTTGEERRSSRRRANGREGAFAVTAPSQEAPHADGSGTPREQNNASPRQHPNPRTRQGDRSGGQAGRPSAAQSGETRAGRPSAAQSTRSTGGSGRPPRNPASSYNAERYRALEAKRPTSQDSLRKAIVAAAVVVVVAVVGVFGFQAWAQAQPVDVTINGEVKTISGNQRSIEGLLDEGVVSVTPGNYVAVDGSTMRQGEGTRCTASINGEATDDLSTHLNGGDVIDVANGTDIMEQYTDSDPQTLPHGLKMQGVGAVHLYMDGAQDGEKVTRTGSESGITTEITTKEPVDRVVQYYNVNSNGDKVVALTFDDGPWDESTEAILDILKENDAKATFFTVGQKISGHEDLVKRAADEGHEIGTHTWDHAEGSGQGVSLIMMSSDERKQEVEKGLQAIKDVTGQDASTIFRAPGGNFDESVATDLDGIVTAEIGWNIDTQDWQRPGTDTVAKRIESADPGNIILMHDGGGDRSETVAALREALPKLKEEGYSFITVQELLERYPYQESQGDAS